MKLCPSRVRQWHALSFLAALMVPLASGCQQQATSPTAVAARTFGHRQLEQVLADRPDMAGVLREDDPVVAWVIAGFNGERIGQRVYWNGASPQSGQTAEHSPPYYHYPAHICISGGTETTPVDKWASLVFEFFNLENHKDFEKLTAEAMKGKVSREQYGDSCVALEFLAMQKTRAFLDEHPFPYSQQGHDDWCEWVRTSLPKSAEEYLVSLREAGPSPGYNPREYFMDYYDDAIMPYVAWSSPRDSMQTFYDLFRRAVATIFQSQADKSSGG
jgi:hypothetical protein